MDVIEKNKMIIERETLSNKVYKVIVDKIVNADLTPGTRIKERQLAQLLGVSQTPVREALKRLENELWIESNPHIGSRIKELNAEEIIELYNIREVIEGLAARLAASFVGNEEITELKKYVDRTAGYLKSGDLKASVANDMEFHFNLIKCSKSERIMDLVKMFNLQCMPIRLAKAAEGFLSSDDEYLEEHLRILDALAKHDGEMAEFLVRKHIRKGKEHALDFLKNHSAFSVKQY